MEKWKEEQEKIRQGRGSDQKREGRHRVGESKGGVQWILLAKLRDQPLERLQRFTDTEGKGEVKESEKICFKHFAHFQIDTIALYN